jgi:hypothetical protein
VRHGGDGVGLPVRGPFAPGTVLVYDPGFGQVRKVRVEHWSRNIKNGQPGFGGVVVEAAEWVGMSVWGYDAEVLWVVSAPAGLS